MVCLKSQLFIFIQFNNNGLPTVFCQENGSERDRCRNKGAPRSTNSLKMYFERHYRHLLDRLIQREALTSRLYCTSLSSSPGLQPHGLTQTPWFPTHPDHNPDLPAPWTQEATPPADRPLNPPRTPRQNPPPRTDSLCPPEAQRWIKVREGVAVETVGLPHECVSHIP